MSDIETVLAQVDADLDSSLERLFALLRIKSVSTDPAFADDCIACADHLVADLKSIGFDASRRKTIGHPIVVAHGGPDAVFLEIYQPIQEGLFLAIGYALMAYTYCHLRVLKDAEPKEAAADPTAWTGRR